MIPQTTGNETNIKLPFSFILLGLAAFIASQIILLIYGNNLIIGSFRIPAIWSAAHLFILGWAVTTAMGAMYQLVPVAFLTPIWSEKLGFFQFFITAIGILWFAHALFHAPETALIPAGLTVLGILLFLLQMLLTLKKQAKPNVLTLFVGTGLICFLLTILLGISLVFSWKTGFLGSYYQPAFKSHLLLGTTGWFTLLIFGFSYKMVPMFSLSHGFTMKMAKWVFITYFIGLVTTVYSFFTNSQLFLILGLGLLFFGFTLFSLHIRHILKKRIKKKLDRPFKFALLSIVWGFLIHLLAVLTALFGHFDDWVAPLMFAYIYLWIALSIMGYLYKIVPFLWWTHKYSKEIGKKNVPVLKDMINDRLAVPLFISDIIGVLLVAISIGIKQTLLFYIGQAIFCLSAIVFSTTIALVMKK
ncbi:hypothetical protein ACE38V_04470 [Cytobacillus sp. Hz8]|uniref:hypothetical protein n=1 Tax=Cytobacillus sp. Hz8 TaxID=3347168 RepID=UPI0035DB4DBA